jgi:acetyl esterase/lipase
VTARIPATFAVAALLVTALPAWAQARIEGNVVYGMHSGTALLLDVHYPAQPNGIGIVFIAGSGWRAQPQYSAVPLKESSQVPMYVPPLTAAGYTVFTVTHRATPGFQYPEIFEDVQRAIRFIRHHADRYRIDPRRIGGAGGSSGAHLLSLAAALDGAGATNDPDPINRQSAKLQCIVSRAGPMDLTNMSPSLGTELLTALFGAPVNESTTRQSAVYKTAWSASPLAHVSSDDPPFLFIHGDADKTVPFAQSTSMQRALANAGVAARLIRIEGGDHGPEFPGATNLPDYKKEMVQWFDIHLRGSAGAKF